MPRLLTSLLRRARQQDTLLPLLLRSCRDFPSARNELRWLREHALKNTGSGAAHQTWQQHLRQLCIERSKGKPLQYILGSQPFGDLDILCRPSVLIPRSAPSSATFTSRISTNAFRLSKPRNRIYNYPLSFTHARRLQMRRDQPQLPTWDRLSP